METQPIVYTQIDKNTVHQLKFSKEDVLENAVDKNTRDKQLDKAQALGNLDKHHVRIRFKDLKGENLETTVTVWAVTKDYVVLKGENLIPIISITEIKLY